MGAMIQPTFDLFEPPAGVPAVIPETDCEACGAHLVGWFDINTNHGNMHDRRGLGPECMAMYLTANHVFYQLEQVGNPDPKFHVSRSNCNDCRRKRKATLGHVVAHNLSMVDHYLNRVHEVWPVERHAALDNQLAAYSDCLGITALLNGDEVPE